MKTTLEILKSAKSAAVGLGILSPVVKNKALLAMADALEENADKILTANAVDVENAKGVLPDVMIDMILQSRELYAIAEELSRVTGEKSSNVATLEKVAWLLERMGTNEDEVAKYLDQLKSYIGSLGTWVSDAKTQPLQLDYLVVQPLGDELPKA